MNLSFINKIAIKYFFIVLLNLLLLNISIGQHAIKSCAELQGDSILNAILIFNSKNEFQQSLDICLEAERKISNFGLQECEILGGVFIQKAYIQINLGKYQEAENTLNKVTRLVEMNQNWNPIITENCLTLYYRLYYYTGEYSLAEKRADELLSFYVKSKQDTLLKYADALNQLALVYLELGKMDKIEPLYVEAIKLNEKYNATQEEDFGVLLQNMGYFYFLMHDYSNAEKNYQKAMEIIEHSSGKENVSYASALNMLATLYRDQGKYKRAEIHYLESLRLRKVIYGIENTEYLITLDNLATCYMRMEKLEAAEKYLEEANDIWLKLTGKESIDYGINCNNLAKVYAELKKSREADSLYKIMYSICKKTLGSESPSYIDYVQGYALFTEKERMYEKTDKLMNESDSILSKRLVGSVSFLSEDQLTKYNNSFVDDYYSLLSIIYQREKYHVNSKVLSEIAFNNSILQKGFILTSIRRLNNQMKVNPDLKNISQDYILYRNKLSQEYSKPIDKRSNVENLKEEVNLLEKKIARYIAGYEKMVQIYKWRDIQNKLKDDEAVIEFVHFKVNFPDTISGVYYAAFILKKSSTYPRFVYLFEQSSLDSLMRSNLIRKADYVNELYSRSDRGAMETMESRNNLYSILWKPLESQLNDVGRIYYSASGLLHRINVEAIPISETETLADRFNLYQLHSARELVVTKSYKYLKDEAILYGGIKFEQDSTMIHNEPLIATRSKDDLSMINIDSTLRGGSWSYLSGTEREVNAIERIMQTSGVHTALKKGFEATEESFKNIGINNSLSPRILHIATHGYFFPDRTSSAKSKMTYDSVASEGIAKAASSNLKKLQSESEPVFKISEHPMLRSGLIMAGGNTAWQGAPTLEGREDGILTAYEISQMNLSNTELVVLSACETGLGDIQGSEGVYGLQRAFKIAGAKYLIMSLWQVPDKQTSLLMTTFYKKWLQDKMNIPDAFHAAQKELRDIGLDPYQWAGFVLVE